MRLDIGAASRCAPGETVCGDDHVVVANGTTCLIGLIDALGHGPVAHESAQAARRTIEAQSQLGLRELLYAISDAIRSMRGAAVALMRVLTDVQQMTYVSVGNIDVIASSKAAIRPFPSRGIVGRRVTQNIHLFEYPLAPGDRVVLFTDGISRRRLELKECAGLAAQQAAQLILKNHGVAYDDATCVVVDLL
jgi:negative regulator of sigma-B (phosphoserine phosphatase)